MKPELLISPFLPASILSWVDLETCVSHYLFSNIYLTLIYAIEYPIKISSSTCLHINSRLPCGNINDTSKYSKKMLQRYFMHLWIIHGLRDTHHLAFAGILPRHTQPKGVACRCQQAFLASLPEKAWINWIGKVMNKNKIGIHLSNRLTWLCFLFTMKIR